MKQLVLVAAMSFLVSISCSSFLIQIETGVLTENRKTALTKTVSEAQLDNGAIHYFTNISSFSFYDEFGTCSALAFMSALNCLDSINTSKAIAYIASQQRNDSGSFGVFLGYDGEILSYDMSCTYFAVHTLKTYDALDQINVTAVEDFLLTRHNQSTGAFSELPREVHGRRYAMAGFALQFTAWNAEMAYAIPNVISTYLAVSTLADLGMLQLINVSRTAGWLMSCIGSNGAFKPYPEGGPVYVPGWSSLVDNPFDVDRNGTGVPYTFAAIRVLKALGELDLLSADSRNRTCEYLLSCRTYNGADFYLHQDSDNWDSAYTYYAITALDDIGMLQSREDTSLRVVRSLLGIDQMLSLDNSWPVPLPSSYCRDKYGLFYWWSTDPLYDTFYAIMILNSTNSLHLLGQLTPRAFRTWISIVELSTVVTAVTTIVLLAALAIQKRRKKLKNLKTSGEQILQKNMFGS